MSPPAYPHRYPFRFVELRPPGEATIRLSAAASPASGGGSPPWVLGIEAIAQSALVLRPPADGPAPQSVALAGIDRASCHEELIRRPLAAGDTLIAGLGEEKRLGRLCKLSGWLERDGERVVEVDLVLLLG